MLESEFCFFLFAAKERAQREKRSPSGKEPKAGNKTGIRRPSRF
jgi:hypothetical protein